MLEVLGEGLDLQARCDRRSLPLLPANDLREVHRRKEVLLRFGQHGVGANLAHRVEAVRAAGRHHQGGYPGQRKHGDPGGALGEESW